MPAEALKVMRYKLQALVKHNKMVPCLISFVLLSYPNSSSFSFLFCVVDILRTLQGNTRKFQGRNVLFPCMRTVQELNQLYSERSLTSQFVPSGGAGVAGQEHTLAQTPQGPATATFPVQGHPACAMSVSFLFCYSTTESEGFHMFIKY